MAENTEVYRASPPPPSTDFILGLAITLNYEIVPQHWLIFALPPRCLAMIRKMSTHLRCHLTKSDVWNVSITGIPDPVI